MRTKPRALTMLELIAVMVILALLGTFSVYGVRSTLSRAERGGALIRIEAARSAGRAAAAANSNTFPFDMVAKTPVSGIDLTDSYATGTLVSVFRSSGSAVSYATLDGDSGCVGVIDNITTRVVVFVRDRTVSVQNCAAARVAALGLTQAADQNNATIVDLDAVTAATTTVPGATTTPTTAPPTVPAQPLLASFSLLAGDTQQDEVIDATVLPDGSSVLVGSFTGSATVASTSLVSAGSSDVFIGRVSSSGSWQWALRAGGTGADAARAVAVSSLGDIYVAGSFTSSATFGSTTLTSSAQTGLFVALLSASGTWKWAASVAGSPNASYADVAYALSPAPDGTVFVAGQLSGSPVLGTTTFTSAGGVDGFVGKMDQYGSWLWATPFVSSGASDAGYSLTTLPDGGVLLGGAHSGAVFGSTTLNRSGTSTDGFVARMSSSGSWQWAVGVASTTGSNSVTGVTYSPDGSAYATGGFWGTTAFGSTSLVSQGSSDSFVAKVSLSGVWSWAVAAGSTAADSALEVVALSDSSVVVSSTIKGSATYGSLSVAHPSAGTDDIVIGKVSASGVWAWATRAGSSSPDQANGMKVRSDGSILIAGVANTSGAAGATVAFGSTALSSSGSGDMFVSVLSQNGAFT